MSLVKNQKKSSRGSYFRSTPNVNFKKNCLDCQYDKACPYRILTGDPQASVKERFRRVPHSKIWTKMKQMVQSVRSYQPIDTTDESVYRVLSLAVYNKRASTYLVRGFGCDNTPVRKYKALEIETGIAALSKIISSKESSEKFIIEFPYKSDDIAYAILGLKEWVVFLEILFSDRKEVKKLTEATFENFKLVFKSIEGDKPSIEELQSLNPDQKMQLCSVCDTTDLCLAKSLLKILEEQ